MIDMVRINRVADGQRKPPRTQVVFMTKRKLHHASSGSKGHVHRAVIGLTVREASEVGKPCVPRLGAKGLREPDPGPALGPARAVLEPDAPCAEKCRLRLHHGTRRKRN